MTNGIVFLGDSHNFGRSVLIKGDWVVKPRPLFWEWLFLDEESLIRRHFLEEGIELNPFSFFPNINIKNNQNMRTFDDQEIQFYKKSCDISEKIVEDIPIALGYLLAVVLVFGLTDLHLENIVFSEFKSTKSLHLFPIDIETALDPLQILSQSYFLKSVWNDNSQVGLKHFDSFRVNPARVIYSFMRGLQTLRAEAENIEDILINLDIDTIPNRRILKSTKVYSNYLRNIDRSTQFESEEILQLERGDIPYFFSYGTSSPLFVIDTNGVRKTSLEWDQHYPIKRDIFENRKVYLNIPSEEQLKISILQLARNFSPESDGIYDESDISVEYSGKNIFVKTSGFRLRCKNLLS